MISRARESDLAAIVRLENEASIQQPWSENEWLAEIRNDNRAVFIARNQDQAIAVASFSCFETDAELFRVIVDEPFRGCGWGRELVRAGLCWAISRGANRILLEVSTTNTKALRLYQRLGFTEISRRSDYYAPGDDALIYLLPLGKGEECCE